MKYHLIKIDHHRGLTIIEIIIYIALLAVLMVGFLQYAVTLHINDINLINDIQNAYQK